MANKSEIRTIEGNQLKKDNFDAAINEKNYREAFEIAVSLLGTEVLDHISRTCKRDRLIADEVYQETLKVLLQELENYTDGYHHVRLLFYMIAHRTMNIMGALVGHEAIRDVRSDIGLKTVAAGLNQTVKTVHYNSEVNEVPNRDQWIKLMEEMFNPREIAILTLHGRNFSYEQIATVLAGNHLKPDEIVIKAATLRKESDEFRQILKSEAIRRGLWK